MPEQDPCRFHNIARPCGPPTPETRETHVKQRLPTARPVFRRCPRRGSEPRTFHLRHIAQHQRRVEIQPRNPGRLASIHSAAANWSSAASTKSRVCTLLFSAARARVITRSRLDHNPAAARRQLDRAERFALSGTVRRVPEAVLAAQFFLELLIDGIERMPVRNLKKNRHPSPATSSAARPSRPDRSRASRQIPRGSRPKTESSRSECRPAAPLRSHP